jgi:hypothetical protein
MKRIIKSLVTNLTNKYSIDQSNIFTVVAVSGWDRGRFLASSVIKIDESCFIQESKVCYRTGFMGLINHVVEIEYIGVTEFKGNWNLLIEQVYKLQKSYTIGANLDVHIYYKNKFYKYVNMHYFHNLRLGHLCFPNRNIKL